MTPERDSQSLWRLALKQRVVWSRATLVGLPVGRILTLPPIAAGGLPLLPPREERVGERRASTPAISPLPGPLPAPSSQGEGEVRGQCQDAPRGDGGGKILLAPEETFPQDSRIRAALAVAARQ